MDPCIERPCALAKRTNQTEQYFDWYDLFILQNKYPDLISDARGLGTFLAISCATPEIRDEAVGRLRDLGWFICVHFTF